MVKISGGDKLDKALRDLEQKITKSARLRVGFLEGATYPDGTPVAMVAAIQNFGGGKIPPRPFFTNMVKDKGPKWGDALGKLLQANDFDASRALELMGEGISGQLRQAIVDVLAPPLAPLTLMLRQMRAEDPNLVVTGATLGEAARRLDAGEVPGGVSTKPLVDSGHMLASISYEVDGGE